MNRRTLAKTGFIWMRLAQLALVILLLGFADTTAAQVSLSISPSSVTLATVATQAFTATVSGSSNTAVTWEVNGVAGGNSTSGLISTTVLGTANEAIYLGPSSVPSPASVSVTAVSQADPTKSATATVTIQTPSRSGVTYGRFTYLMRHIQCRKPGFTTSGERPEGACASAPQSEKYCLTRSCSHRYLLKATAPAQVRDHTFEC